MSPTLIILDSPIGGGKSSSINALKAYIEEKETTSFKIAYVAEPVLDFLKWKTYTPLALMESNPTENAKIVQLHIIRTLAAFYRDQFELYKGYDIIICDRYMQSTYIFIYTLFECGFITEFEQEVLLATLKDYEMSLPKADSTIYLKRDTAWCLDHIQLRSRDGELKLCTEKYIGVLVKQYEKYMFSKENVHVVNSTDLNEITKSLFQFVTEKICSRKNVKQQ